MVDFDRRVDTDYQEALAWAAKRPDAGERNVLLTRACYRLARQNPAEAMAVAEAFHLGDGAEWVLKAILQEWTVVDPPAALAWVLHVPKGERRERLLARHAWVRARSEPAEALALIMKEMSFGPGRDEAVVAMMHEWAKNDLEGAVKSVDALPSAELKSRVLQELERSAGLAGY